MVLAEDEKTGGQESSVVLSEAQNSLISVFYVRKWKIPCRIVVKLSFDIWFIKYLFCFSVRVWWGLQYL